jgi:hypothetical protein
MDAPESLVNLYLSDSLVTGEAILEILGGLPEEDEHCAFLADETLQEAVIDYMLKTTRKERVQTFKTNMQPDP